MNNMHKLISDAEKKFEKFKAQENWAETNASKAYLSAAQTYAQFGDNPVALEMFSTLATRNLEEAIEKEEYGDAAYWRSYMSGWMFAETSYRLDELESVK